MNFARGPQANKRDTFGPRALRGARLHVLTQGCELLETRWLLATDFGPRLAVELEDVLTASPMIEVASFDGDTVTPFATSSPTGYTPAKIRAAYNIDDIFFGGGSIAGDGTGQTIAIIDAFHTPTVLSDLTSFSNYFGLPMPPTFTQVAQDGTTNYPADATGPNQGWSYEALLDVQWAHAIAPGANIMLVEAADASLTNLGIAINYARSQPGVSVISLSWGREEYSTEFNYDTHFQATTNHANVAYVAATGDFGAPGSYPAYSPGVMAIGGTNLSVDGSGNYISEKSWNRYDPTAEAPDGHGSGGGISLYESQPSWQTGVVTQSPTKRTTPDVAFDADPYTGVPVYDSFNNAGSAKWNQFGGTSFSAPAWAGIIAIADQGRDLAGLPTLDIPELMTSIYAMPASYFHDITVDFDAAGPAEPPAVGYDLVTGRGTPKADMVVSYLVGMNSVAGTVFNDVNGNTVLDGELGLAGWNVYADLDEDALRDPLAVNVFASTDVPKGIPATGTVTSSQIVSGLTGDLTDVNVTLDISHGRPSDLIITLISPNGTHITLANHAGNTIDNYTITTFDDSAAVSIANGVGPFTGSYHPDEMLLDLVSENPNGTWQLEIQDTVTNTSGILNSWSLELTTGDPNTTSLVDGSYYLGDLPTGSYQIRQELQVPYVQTAPLTTFYTVGLAIGDHVADQNFGNQLPITNSTVVGRHIFYNQSAFDGNNAGIQTTIAGVRNDDEDARDATKVALLPGAGAATWANITGYDKGINGIMIDLSTGVDHSGLTLANVANNFTFKVGNSNTPASWSVAPAPTALSVIPGGGVSGSDRVEITWATGAIAKQWLEVGVLPTAQTGLAAGPYTVDPDGPAQGTAVAAGDVFFFGNGLGGSGEGDNATAAPTNVSDELAARANPASLANPALVDNVYDYNKDRFVNAADQLISRFNGTNIATQLKKINIGTVGPLAPEGDSGIASALASTVSASAPASDTVQPNASLSSTSDEVSTDGISTRARPTRTIAASAAAWHSIGAEWSDDADRASGPFHSDDGLLSLLASAHRLTAWRRS